MGILALALVGVAGFVVFERESLEQRGCTMEAKLCPDGSAVGRSGPLCAFAPCPDGGVSGNESNDASEGQSQSQFESQPQNGDALALPLSRADERVIKKPFGISIDPETSPIQPERFRGYHTGTDFETFPDEVLADVPVAAICGGEVIAKRMASGYGGVLVTRCVLGGEPVTVVYGHLVFGSIGVKIGESVAPGERLGILGAAGSRDTDGERKHLHLGIHRGSVITLLGYVSDRASLSDWIDPCLFVCARSK